MDNAEFEPRPLAWKASTLSFVAWPLRLGLRHLSWNVFTFSIKINFKFFSIFLKNLSKSFPHFRFAEKQIPRIFCLKKLFCERNKI